MLRGLLLDNSKMPLIYGALGGRQKTMLKKMIKALILVKGAKIAKKKVMPIVIKEVKKRIKKK
jgi:hypothetical protein